jgi:hypothetical protein
LSVCLAALLACKQAEEAAPAPVTSAASSAAVAAPAAMQEVTFVVRLPEPVGTKARLVSDFTMKLTSRGQVTRMAEHEESMTEVKAADGFRVTSLLVDVRDRYEQKQEGTKAEERTVSPLAGSSFVLSRAADGKLSATDGGGRIVTGKQLELLQKGYGDRLEKDPTAEFLPKRPLKLGEKLYPASSTMLRMMRIADDGKTSFESTEFLLESATGGIATFHVELSMVTMLPGSQRLRARLSGEMRFLLDGAWGKQVDLTGPLTVVDARGTEQADGTFSLKATVDYS